MVIIIYDITYKSWEDFFLPVRGGDSGTQIEGLPFV